MGPIGSKEPSSQRAAWLGTTQDGADKARQLVDKICAYGSWREHWPDRLANVMYHVLFEAVASSFNFELFEIFGSRARSRYRNKCFVF